MSSAVPIHPLVRLARHTSGSLTGVSFGHPLPSRAIASRLFSSSDRSQLAKPSKRVSLKSNEGSSDPKVNVSNTSASPSASSSSGKPQETEKKTLPLDSFAIHSYAASPRGQSTSPPPASVKLTDKRSQQSQKQAQKEAQQANDRRDKTTADSQSGETVAKEKENVSKGASLHPAAVEKDRRASEVAPQERGNASTSSPDAETVRKSTGSLGDTASAGKVTEGIFIPHHRDSIDVESTSSSPSVDTAGTPASSSTPLKGSGGSGGGFVPPGAESSSSGSNDGGSGPPATTQISELGQMRPANPLHPFDTNAFIKRLEEAGFTAKRRDEVEVDNSGKETETSLSTIKRHDPAEAIMEATKHLLISRGERVLDHNISKTEVDNQAYLFTAALSELRTELQVRARNDAAALRSMVTLLQREVDSLNQKMREDTAGMKHDIQVDMNNRKGEAKEEQNTLEQEIQDLNNRFTISISDLKTEIEQNIKWDATRRALTVVFGCIVILIATLTAADYLTREEVDETPRRNGDATKTGHDALLKSTPKSAEELGLVANYDDGDGSRFV